MYEKHNTRNQGIFASKLHRAQLVLAVLIHLDNHYAVILIIERRSNKFGCILTRQNVKVILCKVIMFFWRVFFIKFMTLIYFRNSLANTNCSLRVVVIKCARPSLHS